MAEGQRGGCALRDRRRFRLGNRRVRVGTCHRVPVPSALVCGAGTELPSPHCPPFTHGGATHMKALYVAGFAAALLTTQAFAQAVVIAPEQRTLIRDYVVKEKIRPHRLQSRVTVGATLPADVELAPV